MLTHEQIWQALDALAAKHGMSASGLAKAAGLDPTTFNKSKRLTPDGRQRWPSTESVAKVLVATGETLDDFVSLVGTARVHAGPPIPLIAFSGAGHADAFDRSGKPAGPRWDALSAPMFSDGENYALEVTGEALQPAYRDGDVLVLSLTETPRRGDRVVVRRTDGSLRIGILRRETARAIDLQPLSTGDEESLERQSIASVHRIVWVRQ